MMLTNLADVLRAAGLEVEEIPGWQTRGHGQMSTITCIMCHHTAGPSTGDYPSLGTVRDGRPGLDGPLAQLGLARSGKWLTIAAGMCWHAGEVFHDWQTNPHAIGIEAEGTGRDPWPAEQYNSYVRGVQALRAAYGVPLEHVVGHKEAAKPLGRKTDPNFDMDDFRSAVARTTQEDDEMSQADVQRILNYQRACCIQIQDNTRQLLNNAVTALKANQQTMAVAVNNFVRQTDAGSDDERRAELGGALKTMGDQLDDVVAKIEVTTATAPEMPAPASQ